MQLHRRPARTDRTHHPRPDNPEPPAWRNGRFRLQVCLHGSQFPFHCPKRISGLKFAGGIFTNLTRDHLDYHKTVENYLKAKKKFFDELPKGAFSLTNLDDKNGLVMTQNTRSKVYTYSLRSLSDFKGKVLESHFEGMLLDFNNHELAVRFIGKFNAYNLLAVFGTAVLLGKKEEDVLVALSTLHPVTGRFDAIRSPKGYTAIVDYAHTPDALVNVLNAIHGVLEGKGK